MDAGTAFADPADFGEDQDLYEMANLYPRDTGLPMTVWVSPKGRARHDVRIKVCQSHGERMDADNVAVVGIRPEPRVLHGELSGADFSVVNGWIMLNQLVLIDYWDGRASTVDLIRRLQPV